jgi:hypothetical protein
MKKKKSKKKKEKEYFGAPAALWIGLLVMGFLIALSKS